MGEAPFHNYVFPPSLHDLMTVPFAAVIAPDHLCLFLISFFVGYPSQNLRTASDFSSFLEQKSNALLLLCAVIEEGIRGSCFLSSFSLVHILGTYYTISCYQITCTFPFVRVFFTFATNS